MIRMLLGEAAPPNATAPAWAAAYLSMRFAAYGVDKPFASIYTDDDGCCLSVLDGNGVMTGKEAKDPAEWSAFLQSLPELQTLLAPLSLFPKGLPWQRCKAETLDVMQYCGTPALSPSRAVLLSTPRAVHPLLATVFGTAAPPFDSFYVDTAYRMRHGMCHIAAIEDGDTVLSAAMTVAQTDTCAVIGAVATLPSHRGRGYAADCIKTLLCRLCAESPQRKIFVIPQDSALRKWYESICFVTAEKAIYCKQKGTTKAL